MEAKDHKDKEAIDQSLKRNKVMEAVSRNNVRRKQEGNKKNNNKELNNSKAVTRQPF
jgi:hypothetical protein